MTIIVLKSLLISIFVIYPYQTATEGEYFAKSDENGVMDLCQWWADEARHQHRASKDAQCHSGDELEVFHGLGGLLVQEFRKFRGSGVTSEQARSATEPLTSKQQLCCD